MFASGLNGDAYRNAYDNEALKLSQAGMAKAHADLYNEQAAQMRQRGMYQTPEFASQIAAALAGLSDGQGKQLDGFINSGSWGEVAGPALPIGQEGPPEPAQAPRPGWATPDAVSRYNTGRAAHLMNLGATGNSNAEQMAKAYADLVGQGRIDAAMAKPDTIPTFGKAMAASQGKELFHQGANGVMDKFTGAESLNDVGKSAALENRAQANNANASAAQHIAQRDLTRSKIGQPQVVIGTDGQSVIVPPNGKPLPVGALKMQQEELDAIATATGMNDQLGKFAQQIAAGELILGPVENLISKARNFAGVSSNNSRNFASFQATLEKLRNDSLRLNKGVQTEGDAVRAWNELFSNINDDKVVGPRLEEIQKLNDRAARIHILNVQNIRQNYNAAPLDTAGYGAGTPHSMTEDDRRASVLAARKAISDGFDKAAIIRRLEENGITNHGIK